MKESYGEGLASHTGSESCLDDPRGRGEALTGESTGELLNSENTKILEPSLLDDSEGNTNCRDKQVAVRLGGVRELGMCGHFPRESRDTSERNLLGKEVAEAEAIGKVESQTPDAQSTEESDGNKVPRKSPNKGNEDPAEVMEGKTPTERNSGQEAANRIQGRELASNGLVRSKKSSGL